MNRLDGRCETCGRAAHPHGDEESFRRLAAAARDSSIGDQLVALSNTRFARKAVLPGIAVEDLNLNSCEAEEALFTHACLPKLSAKEAVLTGSNWSHAGLRDAALGLARLDDAVLVAASLRGADLSGASLLRANLQGADLSGARLDNADLRGADLRGARIDSTTSVENVRFEECLIDRINVEILKERGVSRGAQMTMHIDDPISALRLSFSGPWRALHLVGLVVFLLPYLWFIGTQLVEGAGYCGEADAACAPLWRALVAYVKKGGEFSVLTFFLLLVYNVARSALLFKVAELEHFERVNGLPPRFELAGIWRTLYHTRWLVIVNVVLATTHALHLLRAAVPQE
jgi:hypothetical protein